MNKNPPKNGNELSVDFQKSIAELEIYFIRLIRERLGIVIHRHQASELKKVIFAACSEFNCSPQEYLQMLTNCPHQSPILEYLIARITVGETYFFRDKKQMQFIEESLLPQLITLKRKQMDLSLRIWSAGCATGEEIYTLAMMLIEMLPDINKWRLNLLGTDINTLALKKALKGIYSEWSMRSILDHYKQAYFTRENDHYQLSSRVRDMVQFEYLNLNDDNYPSIFNNTNSQDLILCRNVLIYFDNQRIAKLMQKLSLSLVPGGYLLLGASDPVDIKATNLIFLYDKGAVFTAPLLMSPVVPPVAKPAPKITHATKAIPKLTKTSAPIAKLSKSTAAFTPVDEKYITQLLNVGDWQKILSTISLNEKNNKPSAFILNAKATALANLGKLEQAITVLQKCLLIDSTNKYSYLTYALVLTELNRLSEAENVLRKTLFLDNQFVIAHYQLGLLLLRNKQYTDGLKSLRNALNIAKKHNPDEIVAGSQQISFGRLVEILGYEIELYSVTGKKDYEYGNRDSQKI